MAIEVFGGDPNARAKVAADVKYGAQQSAVERAIAALAGQRQADEAGINKYGELGRNAIGQTFDQLVGNLETNRQMVNRDLGIQVDSVGQGFRDANSIAEAARQRALDNLAKTYGGNQAYSTTDIAKYQDPIETLAAQVLGENARNDATFTGNLKNWAAQQDAMMQAGISGAGRDRSNRLAGFETELLAALAEARNQRSKEEYGYQGQLLDLIGERGSFEASAGADFQDRIFDQGMQAAQYNLSEQGQLADQAYKRAQLAQAANEMAMRADLARAEAQRADKANNNQDYWKQLEYELKLKGLDTETARWLAEQEQQGFQNKMGISSFLSQGFGTDDLGNPIDNTSSYRKILEGMGLLAPPPSINRSVGTGGVGSRSQQGQVTSSARSAYGSGIRKPAVGSATPIAGNMASWTGVR